MLDLLVRAVLKRGEAEAVSADHGIGMYNDVVTYNHPGIDLHSGIDDAVLPYPGAVTYIYLFIDFRIVAHLNMPADIAAVAHIDLLSEFRGKEPPDMAAPVPFV